MKFSARYPATIGATMLALLLAAFFTSARATSPGGLPADATTNRYLFGIVLMLIVLPPYILATGVFAYRRSLELVEQLREATPDGREIDNAATAIRGAFKRSWPWGLLAGLVLAPFNTQLLETVMSSSARPIDIALSAGQYVLWIGVGLATGVRVVAARAFSRLGEVVSIDIFDPERIQPLARSRLLDVVVIAGGLALTSLQSLDSEFRWESYRFAFLLILPAGVAILLWPLRSVHRRIRAAKSEHLAQLEELVGTSSAARGAEDVRELETLLAHRDRVRALRTWPLDTPLLSRFAFYVVIPPLAWVGAALVENLVDRIAGG